MANWYDMRVDVIGGMVPNVLLLEVDALAAHLRVAAALDAEIHLRGGVAKGLGPRAGLENAETHTDTGGKAQARLLRPGMGDV